MKKKQLIKKLKNFTKYPKTEFYSKAPVIHRGFPNCFNLSFSEYEMLNNFGQYLYYDKDLIYSKSQPCLRHQDWNTIFNEEEQSYKYLTLFEMADIGGFIIKRGKNEREQIEKFVIKSFVDFIGSIGLDKSKLRISHFQESVIEKATKGKYKIDKKIPTDPMLDYWRELGIEDSQLIPDSTRDTLLSLYIFGLPTPWGYRNEINYLYGDTLIDIGTVEFMRYQPIFKDDKITDIKDFKNTVAVSAVGVERILFVLNELKDITDIDTIRPILDKLLKLSSTKNERKTKSGVQALIAIHRIVADGGTYSSLNTKRRKYARILYNNLFNSLKHLGVEVNEKNLKILLKLNYKENREYIELKSSIDLTIEEILQRYKLYCENDR